MKSILNAFIRNLGNGRAWIYNKLFTNDFFNVLLSPIAEAKQYIYELKYVHFPYIVVKEENVINGEKLFAITSPEGTLEERANKVANEWLMLGGNLHYKNLEKALINAGFKIRIIEIINTGKINLGKSYNYGSFCFNSNDGTKTIQYGAHSGKFIGNGILNIQGKNKEPVKLKNGKNSFYIQGYFTPTEKEWDLITSIVLKLKPGHKMAICQIEERKIADNDFYNVEIFHDYLDGGTPATTDFFEHINK